MRKYVLLLMLLVIACLVMTGQQTQQGSTIAWPNSNWDLSTAAVTRPMRIGTTLPATCTVGSLFYKSDATAGANLYACTAVNSWTLESGGGGSGITNLTGDVTAAGPGSVAATLATVNANTGACGDSTHVCAVTLNAKGLATAASAVAISGAAGATFFGQLGDFKITTTTTVATVNTGCSAGGPCTVQVNNVSYPFPSASTLTVTGGTPTGTIYWEINSSGSIYANYPATLTVTLVNMAGSPMATPAYDIGSVHLFRQAVTAGALGALIDDRASFYVSSITAGAGIGTIVNGVVAVDSTVPQVIASGAKALATGAIGSAACTAAQTATATGVLTTDVITASFNGDPTAVTGYVPLTTGMLTIIVYPVADLVSFKVCNNSSSSITPGAITLNWRVVR